MPLSYLSERPILKPDEKVLFEQNLTALSSFIFKFMGYDEKTKRIMWRKKGAQGKALSSFESPVSRCKEDESFVFINRRYLKYDEVVFLLRYKNWPEVDGSGSSNTYLRQIEEDEKQDWLEELEYQKATLEGRIRVMESSKRYEMEAYAANALIQKRFKEDKSRFSGVSAYLSLQHSTKMNNNHRFGGAY